MRTALIFSALLLSAGAAEAKITQLNASCPTGIEFHADDGGYVYINGKAAKLKVYSPTAYDAKLGRTTVSVLANPDGTFIVTYTGKGRANGVCAVN